MSNIKRKFDSITQEEAIILGKELASILFFSTEDSDWEFKHYGTEAILRQKNDNDIRFVFDFFFQEIDCYCTNGTEHIPTWDKIHNTLNRMKEFGIVPTWVRE